MGRNSPGNRGTQVNPRATARVEASWRGIRGSSFQGWRCTWFSAATLNPVRPGLVDRADAYPWSSHAANTGVRTDPLVRPHGDLVAFTFPAYRSLFDQDFDATMLRAIRVATDGGYPLASENFKSRIIALGGRMARGKPGRRAEAR